MNLLVNKDSILLDALQEMSPESSKTTLRSWLKDGRISVDGEVVKLASFQVNKGQRVALGNKTHYTKERLRIIYQDQHLIAIDKPEGLLSVATVFEKEKTVHAILKQTFHPRKIYVVHRLDQDTSGVLLFALSEEAYHRLKKMLEKHEIKRQYAAIIEGKLPSKRGTWQSYLYEDSTYFVRSVSSPEEGELAITHYDTKGSSRHYSFLEVRLETGRKNQIRVHCSEAGHPIAGDLKYGAKTNPAKRLCLHAHTLELLHPVTGKKMHFTSPLPDAFKKIVNPEESHA